MNVEWKARARDPQRQRDLAAALADGPPELLEQCDTFFNTRRGRLKLRQFAADRAELIFYERPDVAGPKPSHYLISPTDAPAILRQALAGALGVCGEVRKHRHVWLVGQARIHLDEVDRLGCFLEVEVVLRPGQDLAEAERMARELARALEVRDEDLVEGAYIDLLGAAGCWPPSPAGV
jgi:adenylate cyclase class IV